MQNSKSVALPDPEIIGGTQKIGQSLAQFFGYPYYLPGYAHAPSSQKFLMDFSSDASYMNVPAKLEVRSFTCS